MAEFILYGTAGCHLCEEALSLLQATAAQFAEQDIIDDPEVMQRYAVRIPVLLHCASSHELGWPFDAEQLRAFLSAH